MIKAVIFDMYETLITLYAGTLYFGVQMAADIGMVEEQFRRLWDPIEDDRTLGKVTLEQVLEMILKENKCYSKALMDTLVQKRIASREECFLHMHPEIIPLFQRLKEKKIKIGLISNCFSEEAYVIRKSVLFPYFDAVCLSYEQGVKKPDTVIYERCMEKLEVHADECLYVGDGGSFELETAQKLGMQAIQAVWYLKEGTKQPVGRKDNFRQMKKPLDVFEIIG